MHAVKNREFHFPSNFSILISSHFSPFVVKNQSRTTLFIIPIPERRKKKSFLQFQFSRIETNEGLLRREVALDKKYHISRPNDAFIRKGKFEVTLNPLSTPRSFFRYFPLYLKEGRPPQLNEIAYRRRAGSIFGFWTCVVTTDKTIMYSNVAL